MVKSHIKFLWRSKNQHGVHSPFVYNLLTKGIYKAVPLEKKLFLKQARTYLRKKNLSITVDDFGAGSRVFKSNERSVSQIAKYAGMGFPRQQLMYKTAQYLKPKNMLELGTSVGLGSVAMQMGNLEGELVTVERCTNTIEQAKALFTHLGLEHIKTRNELFADYLKNTTKTFDLIYVDGGHTQDFTLRIFDALLSKVNNDSVIIFDDIYWSKEMATAWQQIKVHPKVTVSIDSYHWGWVFFRKEQQKEHFVLRM